MLENKLPDLYALSQRYLETKNAPYRRAVLEDNTLFAHRLSILLGQRGVGKTTLIIQYLLANATGNVLSPQILYVPADHFLLGGMSLYHIAEQFEQHGGKWIAFDEIHKYPNWSMELKSIYDTFPTLNIIASGSSALAIYSGSHDLTRRAIVHEIVGFSLREYLELEYGLQLKRYTLAEMLQAHQTISRDIIATLATQEQKILPVFKHYLQGGYYPYARELETLDLYWLTLEQNLHTTIESDLAAILPDLSGHSLHKLAQLLAYIAEEVPFVPNLQRLKKLVNIGDDRTLKNYFKYLEDARLIRQLSAASTHFKKLEIPEKIYLDNTNQLFAISKSAHNIGTVRELFFLSMLSTQHTVTAPQEGDFLVDNSLLFEIGGPSKKLNAKQKNPYYLVKDGRRTGHTRQSATLVVWVSVLKSLSIN